MIGWLLLLLLLLFCCYCCSYDLIFILSFFLFFISDIDFFGFYAWVGVWNAIFLVIYAIFEAGVLIRYSTVWVEETFGFFIAIAFAHDAIRPLVNALLDFYYECNDDRYCFYSCFSS